MHYKDLLKIGPIVMYIVSMFLMMGLILRLQDRVDELVAQEESKSQLLTEQLQRAHDTTVTNQQLQKKINELVEDNTALKKDLDKLKAKPKSVGNVVVTNTGTTETSKGTFPPEHTYKAKSGMPVAHHTYKDDEFTAETYDLSVTMNIVTAEDKKGKEYTYVESTIQSSGEDKAYPAAATASFSHTRPKSTFQLFDPHLNLGLSVPIPQLTPRASLGINIASIGATSHDNSVRFLNPNIEVGKSLAIGVDPVGVNISKLAQLPLIQDTWLWAGISNELVPHFGQYALTVSIASTL